MKSIKSYKRQVEMLESEVMKTELERRMHYQDSIALQKLSVVLGCIIVALIIYIIT